MIKYIFSRSKNYISIFCLLSIVSIYTYNHRRIQFMIDEISRVDAGRNECLVFQRVNINYALTFNDRPAE